MRLAVTLLLAMLSALSWAQELTVRGRVVDAETGEPLPYAAIYCAGGRGAMTNTDGDFRLSVSAGDVLTFSFVGFEKQHLAAIDVPMVVRLVPFTKDLSEVTIYSVNELDIVRQVIKNLKRDFSRHKRARQGYFLRTLLRNEEDSYLIESLLTARSAVSLREEEMLSARTGLNQEGADSRLALRFANIQRVAEIGPSAFTNSYWLKAVKPLHSFSMTKKYYKTNIETLSGSEGERLYRITFSLNDRQHPRWQSESLAERRRIVGTAYVDASTLRLLRFDGTVENAYQSVDFIRMPTDIRFRITYDYSQGFASVGGLSFEGGNDRMRYRGILFDVRGDSLLALQPRAVGFNILSAADDVGFDSTLWTRLDIVKRTAEEERAAFGESLATRPSADTPQGKKTQKDIRYPEPFRPLMDRLTAFGRTVPQEKVYVHMDNTCYFQGDTIWFSAYTMQTDTDRPSDVSGVLYVELLNDDGYLVERKLVEMSEGRGNGFFALNHQIQYSGFYELRAYTRWQLNWGEHEHKHPESFGLMFRDKAMEREYFRDYDKLYSRVFPVYDRPLAPGDYTRDMTLRVMRREYKSSPEKPELKLSLFPEGGNLVAGVENRVAFEATMSDGQQVDGYLTVGNQTAETVSRGRGMFRVVPESERQEEVTFVATNGERVASVLPKPEEEGVAIQVRQQEDSIFVETHIVGLDAERLALTVMHEGKVEAFHALAEGQTLSIADLSAGIHQVTAFDVDGHVFADRLFFVVRPELSKPTLVVTGLKGEYRPYEKVEMKLKGSADEACVSVAVRDVSQADPLFDNGNIMTEMLLSSEVKGFIPNPAWFFEKDDEEHRRALDLLMMTQGWRRFAWRDMATEGAWNPVQPKEQTPVLRGYVYFNPDRVTRMLPDEILESLSPDTALFVNQYAMPNPTRREYKSTLALAKTGTKSGLLVHAELTALDTRETQVNEEPFLGDYFQFNCPKFYGARELFISVADTIGWNRGEKGRYEWVQYANGVEADYRAYVSWPYPRFVKPYSFYQSHMPQRTYNVEYEILAEPTVDSAKALRQVSVTAKRRRRLKGFSDAFPAFAVDANDAWNAIEDAGVPVFNRVDIAEALVRVFLNDYGINEEKDGNGDSRIRLRYGLSPTRRSLPQHIGIPTDSLYHPKYLKSFSDGFSFSPGEVREYFGDGDEDPRFLLDRFVVYTDYQPRHEGSNRYRGADRPETRVAVYPIYDGSRRAVYRDRHYVLPGFSVPADFYSPDYSSQTPPLPNDYRRTLYWNPALRLDKDGEASITLWAGSHPVSLSVEAEGQAADGTLLWNEDR